MAAATALESGATAIFADTGRGAAGAAGAPVAASAATAAAVVAAPVVGHVVSTEGSSAAAGGAAAIGTAASEAPTLERWLERHPQLAHLAPTLSGRTTLEALDATLREHGRVRLLGALKAAGVKVLADRQRLANELARTVREADARRAAAASTLLLQAAENAQTGAPRPTSLLDATQRVTLFPPPLSPPPYLLAPYLLACLSPYLPSSSLLLLLP